MLSDLSAFRHLCRQLNAYAMRAVHPREWHPNCSCAPDGWTEHDQRSALTVFELQKSEASSRAIPPLHRTAGR